MRTIQRSWHYLGGHLKSRSNETETIGSERRKKFNEMQVNVNDRIVAKLTDFGLNHLKKIDAVSLKIGDYNSDTKILKTSLYEFMHCFGELYSMGSSDMPTEKNVIEFENK
jgi:hypothetical protein